MWSELPENKHNDAPRNPQAYTSDMPTFTSDMRMEKIPEIFASSAGHGDKGQSVSSGGGGPVEAVFWMKETMTQWRMRGEAFAVGPDVDEEGDSGSRTVKSQVGKRMKVVDESKVGDWNWDREITGHFGNCSPGMRGLFNLATVK